MRNAFHIRGTVSIGRAPSQPRLPSLRKQMHGSPEIMKRDWRLLAQLQSLRRDRGQGHSEGRSGKLVEVMLCFRRMSGHHGTALAQTDSKRAGRIRIARRLNRCRWILNAL